MDIVDRLKSAGGYFDEAAFKQVSLEEVVNEITSLRQKVSYLECGIAETLEDEIVELRNQLAECQKDADRLDWLADVHNTIGNVQLPTHCVENNMHSLRAAIDAAMSEKG